MSFPETKYMGSKRAILPFIMQNVAGVRFQSVLDAFSGSGCVAYSFKQQGKRVIANDFLSFAYHSAKATIENNATMLTRTEVAELLRENSQCGTFVRETFADLYFAEKDCYFLDLLVFNAQRLNSPLKRSIVLAALSRACMKKRPRGIFTFTGHKGWDGRRDLKLSMKDQFLSAVESFNSAVFSNRQRNKALCLDVFNVPAKGIDLVYIDTPYVSPHSDCDYTRRYHFVEGLCTYWEGVEIQHDTITKKIKSYPTAFASRNNVLESFEKLFRHFQKCKFAVSYGSNGIPNRDQMVKLLRNFKKHVSVVEIPHKYCFGNHAHKVGDNNNNVLEYLFLAE